MCMHTLNQRAEHKSYTLRTMGILATLIKVWTRTLPRIKSVTAAASGEAQGQIYDGTREKREAKTRIANAACVSIVSWEILKQCKKKTIGEFDHLCY